MARNSKTSIEDSMLIPFSYGCRYLFGDMRYILEMRGKNNTIHVFQFFEN